MTDITINDLNVRKLDEQFAAAIVKHCSHNDAEAAHSAADGLLTELLGCLGCVRTVEAWEKVWKYYA